MMTSPSPLIHRDLPQDHALAQEPGVWLPETDRNAYAWGLFRSEVELAEEVPASKLFWSGAQRCTLWLDGVFIADGPARSDRETWGWVSTPLPQLAAGRHVLAIEVHQAGRHAGKGQIGGPSFLVSACSHPALQAWHSSDSSWRCLNDTSRSPCHTQVDPQGHGHRAVGLGHLLDADRYPWDWQLASYHSSELHQWSKPCQINEVHGNLWGNRPFGCHLVSHDIPAMTRQPGTWQRLWLNNEVLDPAASPSLTISQPSRLICDRGTVDIGYPHLQWQAGADSHITIVACEGPVDDDRRKLARDNPLAGNLPGLVDEILLGASPTHHTRHWQPEWIRSLRYLVIDISPGDQALTLNLPSWQSSSYPLPITTAIDLGAAKPWQQLIAVNRQTAAACAHETFFDCPSWEQAQFPGDARIQTRHHYYAGNDDGLAIKAIRDLAASISPSGLLRSHWPSSFEQIIATYSLQWIGMVWDHYQHFANPAPWADLLPTARGIMAWFIARTRTDGLLQRIDEAPFIDWAFRAGCPPQEPDGGSAALTALAAESMGMLIDLEQAAGYPELCPRWQQQAEQWRQAINLCWDHQRQLWRDTDQADSSFSLHTQVQAILAGCTPPPATSTQQSDIAKSNTTKSNTTKNDTIKNTTTSSANILQRALGAKDVTQHRTLYYRSHLAAAWLKAGQPAAIIKLLDDWFDLLDLGITTWPESDSDQARSDCHAWGCMPEHAIITAIFGITATSPGWQTIQCQPHWPTLNQQQQTAENNNNNQIFSCQLQLPPGQFTIKLSKPNNQPHNQQAWQWHLTTPSPCQFTDDQGLRHQVNP